jgi:hypothetical protein
MQPGQVPLCTAGISLPHIAEAFDTQHLSQWCWAASIEMIFHFYGYQVSQPVIVRSTYGVVANIPAVTGLSISQNLNRNWRDQNGKQFQVQIEGLFDVDANIVALDNSQIVDALANERPLLFGNKSHAMVLTAIDYVPPTNIVRAGFADPWPGKGLRGLENPLEMVAMQLGGGMRYLCLPRVTPL